MKQVTILGSTGTIGVNTLDVLSRNSDQYQVYALTAHHQHEKLLQQALQHRPKVLVLVDEQGVDALAQGVKKHGLVLDIVTGVEGLKQVAAADEVDMVMAGIVGAAGLLPTLAAAHAGKRVLLANKEALVMSGQLLMDAVAENGALLLPIDSEHNAIFQCLPEKMRSLTQVGVRRILLTASGGPFRQRALNTFDEITPDEACAHPNWVMGQKISVDSATMMNKGLEVIEAHWLFGTTRAQVEVIIHPQSLIHSMVEYCDGSVLAEMGHPDMRTPIAHALAWPSRIQSGVSMLDFVSAQALTFEPPNLERFPCLQLAYDALEAGGTAPAILNAANEVAVSAFLHQRIRFTDIARLVNQCLQTLEVHAADTLEQILADDRSARHEAERWLTQEGHL